MVDEERNGNYYRFFSHEMGEKRKEISKLLSKILDFIAHVTFSERKFVKFSNLAEILRQLIKVE